MQTPRFFRPVLLAGLALSSSAQAIPEEGYESAYFATIVPFVAKGNAGLFKARDGESLSFVRFVHPAPIGTIVVLPGRTEPWLKYSEVFYDLYQRGYSLYSYDHRGQGLSRHLVAKNRQIGHIEDFGDYTRDFEDFISTVLPSAGNSPLYLLAHSMGGAIAAKYLSRGATPFRAAVLSAPMLTINTKPYAIPVAKTIAGAAMGLGMGENFAPGRKEYDPTAPFEGNEMTSSPARFWMTNAVYRSYPQTAVGGPSNAWVYRALGATPKIVRRMKGMTTPTLVFQAELDLVVKPKGQVKGCGSSAACELRVIAGSRHEVLMEKDPIRDSALEAIVRFFR